VPVVPLGNAEVVTLSTAAAGSSATSKTSRPSGVVAPFPLELAGAASGLLGQIVISADTAARQARKIGVPVALELELLATHGALHLAGYDDRDPVEAALMHRREKALLGASAPSRLWRGLLPE
jgi:probable rRNA maturation factor